MRAVLVRHGEAEQNAHGIFQGYSPVPLSAQGHLQCARIAERLVFQRPQVLYSSDLRRALESANIIRHQLRLSVRTCKRLCE
jgi:broad specificity phosphatase PhoE